MAPHSVGRGPLAGGRNVAEDRLGRAVLQSGPAHRCRRGCSSGLGAAARLE
jgi:hypothetical protein